MKAVQKRQKKVKNSKNIILLIATDDKKTNRHLPAYFTMQSFYLDPHLNYLIGQFWKIVVFVFLSLSSVS